MVITLYCSTVIELKEIVANTLEVEHNKVAISDTTQHFMQCFTTITELIIEYFVIALF